MVGVREQVTTPILIVGSGGNGIAVAALLDAAGYGDFMIITKQADFGGAWFENTYPGCEVDNPSAVYEFEFQRNFGWKALFAKQPELLAYFKDVASRYGLYERTRFGVELLSARWSQADASWIVATDQGSITAGVLILATGFLEEAIVPELPGKEDFPGPVFHSSKWPAEFTGAGMRVAVVGSGSSAIQIVPALQSIAEEVIQFQRTPTWVLPKNNRQLPPEEIALMQTSSSARERRQQESLAEEEQNWAAIFLALDEAKADEYQQVARDYLMDSVADSDLQAALLPTHRIGCKRPLVSDDYYASLNQPNVLLVPQAVAGLTEQGVVAADGTQYAVDAVVLATGFYFGGHILHQVYRRDGLSVGAYQAGRPRAYKAISTAGCPNLFLVGGAAPNGQIWNGLFPGQAAAQYIVGALDYMQAQGITALEVTDEAERRWKAEADELLDQGPTVRGGCVNYSQDEAGRNKAAWPGSLASMREAYRVFAPADYVAVVGAPVPL